MMQQLKNGIASAILSAMGYEVTIDTSELEDDPAPLGGVCTAESGFTIAGGSPLALPHQ